MTIDAAHVVLYVLGAQEIGVFLSELVAIQAPLGRLLAGQAAQPDDLVGISGFGVGLSRPVAGLASLILRPRVLGQRRLPVRAFVVTGAHFLVAGLAGLRADILRGIHRRLLRLDHRRTVVLTARGLRGAPFRVLPV